MALTPAEKQRRLKQARPGGRVHRAPAAPQVPFPGPERAAAMPQEGASRRVQPC